MGRRREQDPPLEQVGRSCKKLFCLKNWLKSVDIEAPGVLPTNFTNPTTPSITQPGLEGKPGESLAGDPINSGQIQAAQTPPGVRSSFLGTCLCKALGHEEAQSPTAHQLQTHPRKALFQQQPARALLSAAFTKPPQENHFLTSFRKGMKIKPAIFPACILHRRFTSK